MVRTTKKIRSYNENENNNKIEYFRLSGNKYDHTHEINISHKPINIKEFLFAGGAGMTSNGGDYVAPRMLKECLDVPVA